MKASACAIAVLFAVASGNSLLAQLSVGTWVQTAPIKGMAMTVEECCNGGRRLIFHAAGQKTQIATVESRFDGSDAPVLVDGKPTGETIALTRVDERRMTTVYKRNGEIVRTSTSTESADRKALTVENQMIEGGRATGKMIETYARK